MTNFAAKIFAAAGHEFNIDSPKQLGIVLYEELQLVENPQKDRHRTVFDQRSRVVATGAASTRSWPTCWIIETPSNSNRSTWINCQTRSIRYTGRLHTHYSQTWTATGRMQSNDPNLQTIPVRKERGREIRAAFIPRDDNYLILAADYSQIELRIMAALSRDEAMLEAFTPGHGYSHGHRRQSLQSRSGGSRSAKCETKPKW